MKAGAPFFRVKVKGRIRAEVRMKEVEDRIEKSSPGFGEGWERRNDRVRTEMFGNIGKRGIRGNGFRGRGKCNVQTLKRVREGKF